MAAHEQLASYRRCAERITASRRGFQIKRLQRLREQERFGRAAERAAEWIVEDLFTDVLDWSPGDINHQVGYADILLTRLGIKYLIVEPCARQLHAAAAHTREGALSRSPHWPSLPRAVTS